MIQTARNTGTDTEPAGICEIGSTYNDIVTKAQV